MNDLVIRGGKIVDGTGKESFNGDVAVKDGQITEVGQVDGEAQREIDADGRSSRRASSTSTRTTTRRRPGIRTCCPPAGTASPPPSSATAASASRPRSRTSTRC